MSHCAKCCNTDLLAEGFKLAGGILAVWFVVAWLAPSEWPWQRDLAAMLLIMGLWR